jgi:hypothetical protein
MLTTRSEADIDALCRRVAMDAAITIRSLTPASAVPGADYCGPETGSKGKKVS